MALGFILVSSCDTWHAEIAGCPQDHELEDAIAGECSIADPEDEHHPKGDLRDPRADQRRAHHGLAPLSLPAINVSRQPKSIHVKWGLTASRAFYDGSAVPTFGFGGGFIFASSTPAA